MESTTETDARLIRVHRFYSYIMSQLSMNIDSIYARYDRKLFPSNNDLMWTGRPSLNKINKGAFHELPEHFNL